MFFMILGITVCVIAAIYVSYKGVAKARMTAREIKSGPAGITRISEKGIFPIFGGDDDPYSEVQRRYPVSGHYQLMGEDQSGMVPLPDFSESEKTPKHARV